MIDNIEHSIPSHRLFQVAAKSCDGFKVLANLLGVSESYVQRMGLSPKTEDNPDGTGCRNPLGLIKAIIIAMHNNGHTDLIHYFKDYIWEVERECLAERDVAKIEAIEEGKSSGSPLHKLANMVKTFGPVILVTALMKIIIF